MNDREKVIKGMEQFRADLKPFCGNHADWEKFDAGLSMLKEHEEVVRCKDCENWLCVKTPKNHGLTKCFLHEQFEPNGEWFCADGRKKDE